MKIVKISMRKRKPVDPVTNIIVSMVTLEDLGAFVEDENNRKLFSVLGK